MSSRKILDEAVEYFSNNELEKARSLLKNYIIESAAEILQNITESEENIDDMHRYSHNGDYGDTLADEIEDHKNEIDEEEMMNEEELEFGEEHQTDDDFDDLMDIEDLNDEVHDIKDDIKDIQDFDEEFESKFAEFEKVFNNLEKTEEDEHDEDFNGDGKIEHPSEEDSEHGMGEEEHVEEMNNYSKSIAEATQILSGVKADMKDKTAKADTMFSKKRENLNLGGNPVINKSMEKAFDFKMQEPKNKGKKMDFNSNEYSKEEAEGNLKKEKPNMSDKAPGKGQVPGMIKPKK